MKISLKLKSDTKEKFLKRIKIIPNYFGSQYGAVVTKHSIYVIWIILSVWALKIYILSTF